MTRKVASEILLTVLVASVLTLTSDLIVVRASPETVLYIEPSSIIDPTLTPGSTFTVDVMVSDVELLYDWQANITFNSDVLRVVDIVEGDFLKVYPEGTWGGKMIDASWAFFGWQILGYHLGVSGSGTLATLEFEALSMGESLIEFVPTISDDHLQTLLVAQIFPLPPPWFVDISFTAENGYFSNLGAVVSSAVDIKPDTLNLDGKGRWVTAYVELPETYDVNGIDVSSIMLNDTVPVEPEPTAIGDFDNDGIPDLMVKFDRATVESFILDHMNLREVVKARFTTVTLTITGELTDGTPFQGSDTIKIVCTVPQKL